jgi:hypothetical protein
MFCQNYFSELISVLFVYADKKNPADRESD